MSYLLTLTKVWLASILYVINNAEMIIIRQRSIGCTSQNKLLQRETTTTKQHSYRLYHAQKPTLAQDTGKKTG